MRRKTIPVFALSALLAICVLTACGREDSPGNADKETEQEDVQDTEEATESAVEETSFPEKELSLSLKSFRAGGLDGEIYTQEDITAKDVTVINFWTTTCPPCIAEMPELGEFAESLPENVQVWTVCLDGAYDTEGAKEILEESGYDGVTLISGEGDLLNVCGEIMYTPTTIFVDGDGNIFDTMIIGRQENLAESYMAVVNEVLSSMGEAKIGDE